MDIVRAEDEARGREVKPLSEAKERELGCDFTNPSEDGTVEYVEVKGWREREPPRSTTAARASAATASSSPPAR
jgi:hypothetical protein